MSSKGIKKEFSLWNFFFQSWAANLIIFTNVFVYFYLKNSFLARRFVNYFILYPENLMKGKIWCLLTSGFIHSGPSHLALNMLGVFIFARIVEKRLGFIKTMFIYFGALGISMFFSSSIYTFILHKNVAIIGASGAVMGLISAATLLAPFSITYEMIFPIPTMIKGWLFFYADIKGFLGAEKGGISHLSHLCGFLSIAFLVYFLSKKDRRLMRTGLAVNIISFLAFLFLRKWLLVNGQFMELSSFHKVM